MTSRMHFFYMLSLMERAANPTDRDKGPGKG